MASRPSIGRGSHAAGIPVNRSGATRSTRLGRSSNSSTRSEHTRTMRTDRELQIGRWWERRKRGRPYPSERRLNPRLLLFPNGRVVFRPWGMGFPLERGSSRSDTNSPISIFIIGDGLVFILVLSKNKDLTNLGGGRVGGYST